MLILLIYKHNYIKESDLFFGRSAIILERGKKKTCFFFSSLSQLLLSSSFLPLSHTQLILGFLISWKQPSLFSTFFYSLSLPPPSVSLLDYRIICWVLTIIARIINQQSFLLLLIKITKTLAKKNQLPSNQ
ncbi:hypothetical protein BDC45DRAFT_299641 [Circinella umbellata]|nr:hypothetical protein BDC45DRAFT_299641 [Circinella umbellata]